MKKIKSLLSVILIVSVLLGVLSISASASSYAPSPTSGNFYYIQHVGSGKYWDITDVSSANGARLQIWSKAAQHQNQVFYLTKVGNYWKIVAFNSGKVIEVRNNSKSNNAEVAQWDYAGISSQQWSIICNSDGTVSFKNRNSGKYIDVSGNNSANGTKMVQYQSNGTKAQKFKLYRIYNNDIYNATWSRNLYDSIRWTKRSSYDSSIINSTNYQKSGYYPTPGYSYLKKVEYIDHESVVDFALNGSLRKSTLKQISGLVLGEITEAGASYILKNALGHEVAGTAIAIGVLEILASSESDKDWNKFIKTFLGEGRGEKGIKKTTYVKFELSSYGRTTYIKESYTYEYSVWNGNGGVTSPSGYSGYWNYCFK